MTRAEINRLSTVELKALRAMVRAELKVRRNTIKKLPKKQKAEAIKSYKEKDRLRNWTLYTLYLNGGYYYVGITAYKSTKIRYEQHINGVGAKWTKLHKPAGILEQKSLGYIAESKAIEYETAKTIEMIDTHGINKVRGGQIVATAGRTAQTQYNKYKLTTVVIAK